MLKLIREWPVSVATLCVPVVTLLVLYACATSPYRTSETPEQYALATYKASAALVHVSAKTWVDPTIDVAIRGKVRDAALTLEEPLKLLKSSALAVEQARAALAAGTGTEQQLVIALELLAKAHADVAEPPADGQPSKLDALTEALP